MFRAFKQEHGVGEITSQLEVNFVRTARGMCL
jgi:hypothetical protein